MTNLTQSTHTDNKLNNSGYYAVNAERVIQVFELFQMRPSHFTASGKAGAQSVYYDARKIIQKSTNNKWGHHTSTAIQDFCYFTQSESGYLLPWQELVEHQGLYDGIEGAGRRTGNLLITENRLSLKHDAMIKARQQCELSQSSLAEKAALPLLLIKTMEEGGWTTVSQVTAIKIANALDVDQKTIFTNMPDTTKPSKNESPESASGLISNTQTTTGKRTVKKTWQFVLPIFILLFWAGYQFSTANLSSTTSMKQNFQQQTDEKTLIAGESFANTLPGCWHWSNDAYIVINEDGTVNNGPFIATWHAVDQAKGVYTMTWPSFIDTLSLSMDGDRLSGNNNFDLPITATRKTGNKTEFIGTWLWSNGITIEIQDGSLITGGSLKGNWQLIGNKLVIEWPLVDLVKLSADGLSLSTKNQFGYVTAKRDVNCRKQ